MNTEVTQVTTDIIEQVIIKGDLAKLTPQERVLYYTRVCESVGLNPLTKPFEYISLNNKLTLYALKAATDQLRQIHGVSVDDLEQKEWEGLMIVTAKVRDKTGRTDSDIGAVHLGQLKGEALANALMKASTKAKRRATLSICGLGMLDETEIDSIPNAVVPALNQDTGEITVPDNLLSDGTTAAMKGAKALGEWWTTIGKDGRVAVGKRCLTELKAIAEGAEQAAVKPNLVAGMLDDLPWGDEKK